MPVFRSCVVPVVCLVLALAAPAVADESLITSADIERAVRMLAADEMGGRGTPSPGLERAVDFVAGELQSRRLGAWPAAPEYRQPFTVLRKRVDLAASSLVLRDGSGEVRRLEPGSQAIHLNGAPRTLRDVPVLVATLGATLPTDVAGNLVILTAAAGMSEDELRYQSLQALARMGSAAAVLVVSADSAAGFGARLGQPGWRGADGRLVGMKNPFEVYVDVREVARPGEEARVMSIPPALEIAPGAFEGWLPPAGSGPDTGNWRADIELAGGLEPVEVSNVVAWLPGVGASADAPGDLVVVTAHVDHLGTLPVAGDAVMNGADDNASGVAALLGVAGALAASAPPARSVLFAATAGEEHGNWGARVLAESLTAAGHLVAAVVNLDMIGRNAADEIGAITGPEGDLETLAREEAAREPALPLRVSGNRWPRLGLESASDHAPFAEAGIPWLFFFAGTHDDYHRVTDEADALNYDKVAAVARLTYRAVVRLAEGS